MAIEFTNPKAHPDAVCLTELVSAKDIQTTAQAKVMNAYDHLALLHHKHDALWVLLEQDIQQDALEWDDQDEHLAREAEEGKEYSWKYSLSKR